MGAPISSLSSSDLDAYLGVVRKQRMQCGAIAAWYCLQRLGQKAGPEDILKLAHIEANGTSLRNLLNVFDMYGVPAQAIVVKGKEIDTLPVPTILVIGGVHCVVYEGKDQFSGQIRILEPTSCRVKLVSPYALEQEWTGEAIVFAPRLVSWVEFVSLTILSMTATALAAASPRLLRAWRELATGGAAGGRTG
jgi:ABC-type bacteriocin/lantibiotic exporter with double-glycine peptidase domain